MKKYNSYTRYTNEEIKYIKDNVKKYKGERKFEYERFYKDFEIKFNKKLTLNKFRSLMRRFDIKLGKPNWKKINRESAKSDYKIGDERTVGRYTFVKISNGNWNDCWKPKHVYLYEIYHNIKVKENEYVSFLDRNNKNFNIDNLVLLSRKGLGKMSKYNHIKDFEIRKTAYLICQTECSIEHIIKE